MEHAGPILERKGMCAIFQKKGRKRTKKMLQRTKKCLKRVKKGKVFKNLSKNVQNLKIF